MTDGASAPVPRSFSLTVLNRAPVWVTAAGSLGTLSRLQTASLPLTLLDADGDPLTLAVTAGALPAGLAVQSVPARISGSVAPAALSGVTSFTLAAADGIAPPVERSFSLTIVDSAPTGITLTPGALSENAGANARVGTLAPIDVDPVAPSFSLVAGALDNALFTIAGTELRALASLDYEQAPTRTVRVQLTDGPFTLTRDLIVTVVNLPDVPAQLTWTLEGGVDPTTIPVSGPGDQGVSADLTFRLTNNGELTSGAIRVAPLNTLSTEIRPGGTCVNDVTILAPGASCTVVALGTANANGPWSGGLGEVWTDTRVTIAGTASGICPQSQTVLSHTGSAQTYTVPAGCTRLRVRLWGGGGGGGDATRTGGGGGAAYAVIPTTPGETLNVVVGGGGGVGAGTGAYGNGGSKNLGAVGNSGRGGGLSGVFRGTAFVAGSALVVAGGGGGGTSNAHQHAGQGGAGGGTVGRAAQPLFPTDFFGGGGLGGTASAGGAAPRVGGGAGSQFQGGHGNNLDDGGNGAGGGGWFGGGGGNDVADTGGGGGSGYLAAGVTGVLVGGAGRDPGLFNDPDRAGAGTGATGGGANGRVILETGRPAAAAALAIRVGGDPSAVRVLGTAASSSETRDALVLNTGGQPTTALTAGVSGAGYSLAADGCSGQVLQPGGSCALTVRLTRTSRGSGLGGTLSVSASTGGSASVTLTGDAIGFCDPAESVSVFGSPGASIVYRVPAGCTRLEVLMWGGAGGGGGPSAHGGGNCTGGNAGGTRATIPVSSLQPMMVVSGGGGAAVPTGTVNVVGSIGGGGPKNSITRPSMVAGTGGGMSAIFARWIDTGYVAADALAVAGGGGGATTGGPVSVCQGGAGGGSVGGTADSRASGVGTGGGYGGTQSAGGAATIGGGAGAQFQGGHGNRADDGGNASGGGGWFGGGGGNDTVDNAGGGGSGYVNTAAGVTGSTVAGTASAPGLATDTLAGSDRSNAGQATAGLAGTNGRVIIQAQP